MGTIQSINCKLFCESCELKFVMSIFRELIVSLKKKKKSSPKDFQYNQISYVRQTCKNGEIGE